MIFPYIEVNGKRARSEDLFSPTLVNYGHFTTMQVRDRKVRGLDLHLHRLDAASNELFGMGSDQDKIRFYLRSALKYATNVSVRVNVFLSDGRKEPVIMVILRKSIQTDNTPQRLMTVTYERDLPHLKHVGTFGQIYYGNLAEKKGFHDALFVRKGGELSETTMANLGFIDGDTIVWPDSPVLNGITMQLVERELANRQIRSIRRRVYHDDLSSFEGGFLTNSIGIFPVGQIDSTNLHVPSNKIETLINLYDSVEWDAI